jgi:hypothetical protein
MHASKGTFLQIKRLCKQSREALHRIEKYVLLKEPKPYQAASASSDSLHNGGLFLDLFS